MKIHLKNKALVEELLPSCIVGLLIYALPWVWFIKSWQGLAMFVAGMGLGQLLMWADELWLIKFYLEPDSTKPTQVISRSALFGVVLVALSFFVITSTDSFIGKGMVMGMLIVLLVEVLLLRKNVSMIRSRFFETANVDVNPKFISYLLAGLGGIILILSLLMLS